ncbi:hypothetical protein [Streptomyces albipurpureus]|uniref:Uncharacterized protein n=1 Tax=Streptomyces albipurpureus TaxID=2897419 RepID=A0ABT0V1F4_9ACTN|nr:hypothetical protein [Streptomyces sp. CWNU-1]MCM2393221.1 hypothetical protein [Streptomyces sp. CWNU-1]
MAVGAQSEVLDPDGQPDLRGGAEFERATVVRSLGLALRLGSWVEP